MDWLDPSLLQAGADLEWLSTRLADGLRGGRHRATRRGRGIEFAQHRSYDPGDDVRLLDWRAYARTDRLVVREAESDADHRFWLLVDTSASMGAASIPHESPTKLRTACVLVATLAAIAERQGDDYALAELGQQSMLQLPPGQGRSWYSRLLSRLDGLEAKGRIEQLPRELLALVAGDARTTDVMVFGDGYQLADEWERGLALAATTRCRVHYVCLECDLEINPGVSGARRLVDLESGSSVLAGPGSFARYRERREAHLARLKRSIVHGGGQFSRFRVDEPWDRQLRALLGAR